MLSDRARWAIRVSIEIFWPFIQAGRWLKKKLGRWLP